MFPLSWLLQFFRSLLENERHVQRRQPGVSLKQSFYIRKDRCDPGKQRLRVFRIVLKAAADVAAARRSAAARYK